MFSTINLREIRKILGSSKWEWTTKEVPNIQNLIKAFNKRNIKYTQDEINFYKENLDISKNIIKTLENFCDKQKFKDIDVSVVNDPDGYESEVVITFINAYSKLGDSYKKFNDKAIDFIVKNKITNIIIDVS